MARKFKLILIVLFFSVGEQAKPLAPEQAPEPLRPWVQWVLHDQTELGCPFIYNSYEQKRCSWPSRLDLDFAATSGKFSINWDVYRESWIVLPGNETNWPQNVTANGKNVAIIERNGLPSIKLATGFYQLKGEFNWKAIPESLNIPADTGLISLNINNAPIALPNVRDGHLWLTENDIGRKKPENVQNALDIQVYRLISDEVPMQVTTRLILDVSGEQREIALAKPLLDGFIPLGLIGALPARLEPDGKLRIQIRPGQWQFDIVARSTQETNRLTLNGNFKDWPDSEIWVFDARPDLRVVEVEKLAPIDASQTNSPQEWRHLPTYSLNQGDSMTFKQIRRGDPQPEPNQLTLKRTLWLDFDGGGYTINDVIGGKMRRDWRLDVQSENQLGRVILNSNDQLITTSQVSGKQGVEVRQGAITLTADSRKLGDIGILSAVGWEQSFNLVSAELNLPPGWRLLAANGVDNVPDSWIARWTLLDLFLVLIAALAVSRLFNRNWGIFTALTLALIWHESSAPQYIWLNILAATALMKVLPTGKFLTAATWYRNLCWLGLAIVLIPFMVNQIRTGIYPQLENPWADIVPTYVESQSGNGLTESVEAMKAPAPVASPQADMAESVAPMEAEVYDSLRAGKPKIFAKRSRKEAISDNYNRYDPDAKVQTGPGLPQWRWHRIQLAWNGSVDANQKLKLWYLPPNVVMLLNFLRVILVCILALLLFGLASKLKLRQTVTGQIVLWFLIVPLFAVPVPKAHAEIPGKEILDELKSRILEAPDCLPNCAQIPRMQVNINDKELILTLQVHAQLAVNVPLPAYYGQWLPGQVEIDGKDAPGLYRSANQLWLQVGPGEHTVVLKGKTPLLPSFTLPLLLKPNQIAIENSGWQVIGVQDNGQIETQLQLSRISKTETKIDDKQLASGTLPPYVRVQRTLQLGLDWRVATAVERLSPPDSAIVLQIPLLKGERITTPGMTVKDHQVEVNLAAQQQTLSWESNLEKADSIGLAAANSSQWIEAWHADVSPIWHIESKGISPIRLGGEGQWLPEWRPWPGESVSLQITRPAAVAGQILTIDNSLLSVRPGKRTTDTDLQFTLRSSQGIQHNLILPEQAVLQSLTINGQAMPPRQEGNKLSLLLNPGLQQIAMSWQEPVGISLVTKSPLVDLGVTSVNSKVSIGLGQDRWLLWVWGPKLGPAVLFWGVLVVILILSVGLAKIPLTQNKTWQWFLLLLGLSQMPVEAGGIVVAWMLLLGWRSQRPVHKYRYFNLMQILLAILTLAALAILLISVEKGLLGGSPEMQVSGNQSSAFNLNWYQDRSNSVLPVATTVSMPILAYRLAMLIWSFWLAASLLDWLKWGWHCYSAEGLWHKRPFVDEKQGSAEK